ncbi:hypothetical protein LDC_0209, partial [sediment metagenome]
ALDGSRPGTYWINLRDTAILPSFKLKTLTYHEANPGHHLQAAFGMGVGTPVIATALYSNAFGEGWGLYAEALAKEMGLYAKDPYGDLGRLQDELWRAVRLVVDTGMHSLRWSRAQAIDYAITTAGVHRSRRKPRSNATPSGLARRSATRSACSRSSVCGVSHRKHWVITSTSARSTSKS